MPRNLVYLQDLVLFLLVTASYQNNAQKFYRLEAHLWYPIQPPYMHHRKLKTERGDINKSAPFITKHLQGKYDVAAQQLNKEKFLTMNISSLLTNKYISNLVIRAPQSRTSMTCVHLISQAPTAFPQWHLVTDCLVKNNSIILHLSHNWSKT